MELYHCNECFTMNGEFVNLTLCIKCAGELDAWANDYVTSVKEGWYEDEEPDLSQMEEVLQ
jgi:hypothetical protein